MRTALFRLVPAAVCGGALTMAIAQPAMSQVDPPGNNGTIKIDGVPFDDHPNNQPHVGCIFQVDFYNYDEGDFSATVSFEAQPPTEGGELLADSVFIGEDPAGGGDDDVDASVTYDLGPALAGIEPHPVQGHHVRLTIHAEGSIGADVKHKVFWVEGCGMPPGTPPGGGGPGGPGGPGAGQPGAPGVPSPAQAALGQPGFAG